MACIGAAFDTAQFDNSFFNSFCIDETVTLSEDLTRGVTREMVDRVRIENTVPEPKINNTSPRVIPKSTTPKIYTYQP